ncbi:MAG: PepSY-associated TM helix domain-containing protein [Tardiphaga sp.]
MASPIKSAFLQVHSVVGLAVSLVLGLMGLTGAMLAFEEEIVAALNTDVARVDPRPAPVLTPEVLLAQLQATPDAPRVGGMTLSSEPGAAVRVRFARGQGGDRASVFVDPYDGHLLSIVHGDGFFVTLRNLHRWLLLPGNGNGYGRWITGIAVLGLFFLLVSGLVVRWPKRATSARMWLKPKLAGRGRALWLSLHSVFGTWVLAVYCVTVLTGMWWSFDWYKDAATWLLSSKPAAAPRAAKTSGGKASKSTEAAAGEATFALDRVWTTFVADQGNRYATASLLLPNGNGTVVRVRSVAKDAPSEEARDEFRIDGATGRIVSADRYADKASGDRLLTNILHIHRGAFLGLPGRILFMIAAAMMPFFTVTGFILYFSRRKLRATSKPSRNHQRTAGMVPGE